MAKVSNRGLGSLYVILLIHVVLIVALSPITNAIPPVDFDHAISNTFTFELAPNFFADCNVRQFLFYVDSAGNRRQGDFDFDQASLFTQFDLVSRATGITVEKFEVDTFIKCEESLGVSNFDLVPTSSIVYSVRIDDKNGNAILVKEMTIDPTAVAVGTRQFSTTDRSIDVQNKEVQLATFSILASEIDEKIDPNSCSIFGCATGSTATQTFRTHLRILTDYSFDFDIIGVKWEAFGQLDSGYNLNFVDTDFTGTIDEPKSTDIIIKTLRPTSSVFAETGTRLLEIEAILPEWQTGEGAPTITVKNDDTQGTISSQVMDLSRAEAGSTIFVKRIVMPSSGYDTLKVQVSINGRVTATTYVKTFEIGGTDPPPNPTCNGADCNPPPTCESKNLITSSFLGIGSFCVPPNLAFIFQGFNIIWITAGFVVFLIVIAIIGAIVKSGGARRAPPAVIIPQGF